MRSPAAASIDVVARALGEGGDAVCADLLRKVTGAEKTVAERASRMLKKISEVDRSALYSFRDSLIREAVSARDLRVQWNLLTVLGRLPLQGKEKALVVDLCLQRLEDASSLNRTFALQALMDLSEEDRALRARVLPLVRRFAESETLGSPALRARARRLLKQGAAGRVESRT